MKRFFFLMICLALQQSFIYAQTKMKSFQWLEGEWQMKNKNGVILESWKHVNDTLLKSNSYFINDKGERKLLESVELKYTTGFYYYEPLVQNQNSGKVVLFKITKMDNHSFTAENQQHDFPKRIIYTFINADSIHAVVDDGKSSPQRKEDFYYSRCKKQ